MRSSLNGERVVVTPPMLAAMPEVFEPLRARGLGVDINPGPYPLDERQLPLCLGDAIAVVLGLDRLSEVVLEACPKLRIVARQGVGIDNIDLAAATRRGVIVTVPLGANSTSVAELTMGLLIALARRVVVNHNLAQQGLWQREPGIELAGKTLGIIGLGRIGKKVAARALAFEMRVVACDITPDFAFAEKHGVPFFTFDELLAQSDIVSLHVPLTPLTQRMINGAALCRLKPGAYLLNMARGPVVDPAALVAALDSGHLSGAALDVHDAEQHLDQPQIDGALRGRPNVITTTHLGAYTHESLRRTTEAAVQSVVEALDGSPPAGLLNPEAWRTAHEN